MPRGGEAIPVPSRPVPSRLVSLCDGRAHDAQIRQQVCDCALKGLPCFVDRVALSCIMLGGTCWNGTYILVFGSFCVVLSDKAVPVPSARLSVSRPGVATGTEAAELDTVAFSCERSSA